MATNDDLRRAFQWIEVIVAESFRLLDAVELRVDQRLKLERVSSPYIDEPGPTERDSACRYMHLFFKPAPGASHQMAVGVSLYEGADRPAPRVFVVRIEFSGAPPRSRTWLLWHLTVEGEKYGQVVPGSGHLGTGTLSSRGLAEWEVASCRAHWAWAPLTAFADVAAVDEFVNLFVAMDHDDATAIPALAEALAARAS